MTRQRYRFIGRDGKDYVWQSTKRLPRDSRVEQIRCNAMWFWGDNPAYRPYLIVPDPTHGARAFGWNPDEHHIRDRFRQGFYQVYCSCGWVTNAYHIKRMDAWVEALDHHPEASNPYASYINHTYRAPGSIDV